MVRANRSNTSSLPRITVITPSLNQGRYLERTICSVLDQGYREGEYIIVDAGSTDETADILRIYESDVSTIIREPDAGPAEAINKALKRATGDVIAVVCADDILMPGALDIVGREMSRSNAGATKDTLQWLVGHAMHVDEDDAFVGSLAPSLPESLASYLMHDSGFLPGVATFYRRDVLEQIGGFDAQYRQAYDYDVACRLLAEGIEPRVLHQSLAARRDHAAARMSTHPIERGIEYINAARKSARHLPLKQRSALWVNCDYRERIYTLARAENSGEDARRFLFMSMLRRPWWLVNQSMRTALVNGVAAA